MHEYTDQSVYVKGLIFIFFLMFYAIGLGLEL